MRIASSMMALGVVGVLLASSGVLSGETADVMTAGGGGWFEKNSYKNTFGFYIVGTATHEHDEEAHATYDNEGSSLVFHGRGDGATVIAYDFERVWFSECESGYPVAHARGWATVNGADGYWFHLMVRDGGGVNKDVLHLRIFEDKPEHEDESEPVYHWVAQGLDGGNIWIGFDN